MSDVRVQLADVNQHLHANTLKHVRVIKLHASTRRVLAPAVRAVLTNQIHTEWHTEEPGGREYELAVMDWLHNSNSRLWCMELLEYRMIYLERHQATTYCWRFSFEEASDLMLFKLAWS